VADSGGKAGRLLSRIRPVARPTWGFVGAVATLTGFITGVILILDPFVKDGAPGYSGPPHMSLEVRVKTPPYPVFGDEVAAAHGSDVQVEAVVRNLGGSTATNAFVELRLARWLQLLPNTCRLHSDDSSGSVPCAQVPGYAGHRWKNFDAGKRVRIQVKARVIAFAKSNGWLPISGRLNVEEAPDVTDEARVLVKDSWGTFFPDRPLIRPRSAQGRAQLRVGPILNSARMDTIGDERTFFGAYHIRRPRLGIRDPLPDALSHKGYIILSAYIHNDAPASAGERGTARGARLKISLPTSSGTVLRAVASVSIDNPPGSWPHVVGDSVDLTAKTPIKLEYFRHSARIYRWAVADKGRPLPDSIFTKGVPIGYERMDGRLPPGREPLLVEVWVYAQPADKTKPS